MEIPRGTGVAKPKVFKENYGAKSEFPVGWGGVANQKNMSMGGGAGE